MATRTIRLVNIVGALFGATICGFSAHSACGASFELFPYTNSSFIDLSGDGTAGTGMHDLNGYFWSKQQGLVPMDVLPGYPFQSSPERISRDGSAIIGYLSWLNANYAFRWTAESGIVPLGFLSQQTRTSFAYGLSDDGSVVVGYSTDDAGIGHAVRWFGTNDPVALAVPPGTVNSVAFDVSADGSIIVGIVQPSPEVSVGGYWDSSGQFTTIGFLANSEEPGKSNNEMVPYAISADGSTIVGRTELTEDFDTNFLWTAAGGLVSLGQLGPPEDDHNVAYDVSGDGGIVVGESNDLAFIWDRAHGIRRLQDALTSDFGLDLADWTLRSARAISADGTTIVGTAFDSTGRGTLWIATVPEPSTLAMLLAVLPLAYFTYCRRSSST